MKTLLFADVVVSSGGSGLVNQLVWFLLIGLCVLIVWAVGRWFITKLAAPPMAMTVWTGLFILIGMIVVINFLLGLGGHSFIRL